MGAAGTQGYGARADALAEQYESVSFETVHRDILHLISERPCRVLDVGAGTGRDAAALAARGHEVVAVEPTPELRAHGARIHAGAAIAWVDDALPDLPAVRRTGGLYDLVMLTAVWMHLDEAERRRGIATVARLLAPGGQAALSLRHGPVPPGRRMFDVSPEETTALAREHGLEPVHLSRREDMLGRGEVSWSFLVLRKGETAGP